MSSAASKQSRQPSYLLWPDRWEIAAEYQSGAGAYDLAFRSGHSYKHVKEWLQHLGIYRTQSEAMQLRHKRDRAQRPAVEESYDNAPLTVDPWRMAELEGIAPRPSPALRNFVPMLHVDIITGEVLLNRLAEVLGDVFAVYSQASAFERGRVG